MRYRSYLNGSRSPQPCLDGKRWQAFTLIELLVVIAIIAILAALIFPALQGVQDRGKTVTCTGNLRQIGAAVYAFAGDHDGTLPPGIIQDGSGVNGANDFETILVSRKYISAPAPTSASDVPRSSSFRCPAGLSQVSTNDRIKFSDPAYASNDDAQGYRGPLSYKSSDGKTTYYVHSWYGINSVVNNPPPFYPFWCPQTVTKPDGSVDWQISGGRKVGTMSNNSKVVGLYCGMGFHNGAIARIAARHNKRASVNVMFMDGHVMTLPIADVQKAFLEASKPYKDRILKDISFSTNFD